MYVAMVLHLEKSSKLSVRDKLAAATGRQHTISVVDG